MLNEACNSTFFWPGALGRGQKVKYNLISITVYINFKDFFIPNLVCFSQIKDKKTSPVSCPRGEAWGFLGVKNLIFPNMVTWHIQLKGMMSRTGYKDTSKIFTLGSNW